jgi:hypothetical protein
MSTIRTLITGITVVAAGAGAAAAVAATGTASAGTATSSAKVFTLKAHHSRDSNIDLGDSGFSAGDEDLAVATLTRGGHRVGHLVLNCTAAHVGSASVDQLCEFVLALRGGQITAAGTIRAGQSGPGTFPLPILGGTGRYQGVGGQIAVTSTNGDTVPIQVTLR